MTDPIKSKRTTQGLRDALFDELDELRGPEASPEKSMAVANIAKQIINTAKVELDFHKMMAEQNAAGTPVTLGNLQLGSEESKTPAAEAPGVNG